ncbi:tetratricopeptide repeat protein [Solimonas variicoloris]|uniref:tetratricopeptide repeat protein n=1 Tax=Solimonas variicoloris TaxID=254408 RepID=UPI000477F0EA|nr:tetratricopeptide repeat protein [Solimonas variicoloris]
MSTPSPEPHLRPARWRFGDTELDEFRLEILHRGEPINIESKSLELLRLFVRHPGEVLTKDELMEAVWPGRVLSESVLSRAVSLLRRAIGDAGQNLIRTVHGYGYRFDASVERLTPVQTQSPAALHLQAGEHPPLRPNWRLLERLGQGRNETWLVEHEKTRERRIFKFAGDGSALSTLKREITLQRLLSESLGEQAALAAVLDWNLQQAPYFIETAWYPNGSLESWLGQHPQTPLAQRIEFVAQAAAALAAAHRVGILHKDVKPANLLVADDHEGLRILLADFGSGRLIDDTRLEALSITRLGLTRDISEDDSSGSLLYIAPELLAGQPATLKSDIYALGVLLYQLVVGDLRRPLAPGWERDVSDELLREDIAAAADLDPARRLADASELERRLRSLEQRRQRRTLERESAERAEATRRQMERWRARRGWMIAAYALLVVGLTASSTLYYLARKARDAARDAQAETAAINDFLQHDLLDSADPRATGRSDMTVREVVETAARRIGERFADRPQLQARLRSTLGSVFSGLAQDEAAIEQLQAAIALLQPEDRYPETLIDARLLLADVYANLDRYEESIAEYEAARRLADRHGQKERALETQIFVAELQRGLGQAELGLRQIEALRPQVARLDQKSELGVHYARIRANLLEELGRPEADEAYQTALQRYVSVLGADAPATLTLRVSVGGRLAGQGRDQEALAILDPLYADMQRIYGPTHPQTLVTANQLSLALQHLGQVDRAIALQEFASREIVARFGELDASGLQVRANLATLYAQKGEHQKALDLYGKVYAGQVQALGEDRRETLMTAHNIARSLQDLGRWQEALALQRKTSALAHRALTDAHYVTWTIDISLARTLGALGQYAEAQALMDRATQNLEKLLGREHRLTQRGYSYQKELRERLQSRTAPQ